MCMPRRRCVQVERVFAAITMQKFVRRFLARKAFRARLRIWGMGQAAKVRTPSPCGHCRSACFPTSYAHYTGPGILTAYTPLPHPNRGQELRENDLMAEEDRLSFLVQYRDKFATDCQRVFRGFQVKPMCVCVVCVCVVCVCVVCVCVCSEASR